MSGREAWKRRGLCVRCGGRPLPHDWLCALCARTAEAALTKAHRRDLERLARIEQELGHARAQAREAVRLADRYRRERDREQGKVATRDRRLQAQAVELRELRRKVSTGPELPFTLTDLHGWWLERYSPGEIRALAGGLDQAVQDGDESRFARHARRAA